MKNELILPKKLSVYIDGFNLYFGMRDAGFEHCKWLDVHALALLLKTSDQTLKQVKYFTAHIKGNELKQQRQESYLQALATRPIQMVFGKYVPEKVECPKCLYVHAHPKEKMTDVSIAVNLIVDAYKDAYDIALLISGDSDLVPPILEIRKNFPHKQIFVAFPPKRESNELRKCAHSTFVIGKKKLESCQLPPELENRFAFTIRKPSAWP